jgi:VanZ family protein
MHSLEKPDLRKAVICWFITIGYMGIIFSLSSHSWNVLPHIPKNVDKIIHLIIYVLLAFLLSLSLKRSGIKRYVFVVAFLFASIYGITDEIHQSFVPGRYAAVGDVLADSCGALIGGFWASFLRT